MKKIIFLLFTLPLFLGCSSDDNELSLRNTKWTYKRLLENNNQYWIEELKFTSNSDCTWMVITKTYVDDYYDFNYYDGLILDLYNCSYSIKNMNINISNKDINDNIEAIINWDSKTITIGNKIFVKQ